jgi:5'-nucleotidase
MTIIFKFIVKFVKNNIIIPDQNKFDAKLKAIVAAGKDKLHVRMDFDGTVTKADVGGKRVPSLVSIICDENILGEAFSQAVSELYKKYRPIEIDPDIGAKDKKILMLEWWNAIYGLMIKNKLSKRHIEQVSRSTRIQLRDGFKEFAAELADNNIPLVIMSAGGLGVDGIDAILQRNGIPLKNIIIAGNRLEWDNGGCVVAVKEPIVHTLNKNEETLLREPAIYEMIKNRPNVLLFGDTLADIAMVEGADIANLLSFGFLNIDVEKQMEMFKQIFDIVILNDDSMDFVNQTLRQILEGK